MQQTNRAACKNCEGHVEYPPELEGQTTPCPHCGVTITLGSASVPSNESPALGSTSQHIAEKVQGRFVPLHAMKRQRRVQQLGLFYKGFGYGLLAVLVAVGGYVALKVVHLISEWFSLSGKRIIFQTIEWLEPWYHLGAFLAVLLVIFSFSRRSEKEAQPRPNAPDTSRRADANSLFSAFFAALATFAFNQAWVYHWALVEQTRGKPLFSKARFSTLEQQVVFLGDEILRGSHAEALASNQLFWLHVSIWALLMLHYTLARNRQSHSAESQFPAK